MQPLELAKQYMNIIFDSKDFAALHRICASDLRFSGPLFTCETLREYIAAMDNDPPDDFNYEILKTYEDEASACIIYEFSKPGTLMTMMQMFEITDAKICSILLLFDTKNLTY